MSNIPKSNATQRPTVASCHSKSACILQRFGGEVFTPNKAASASAYGYQRPARHPGCIYLASETAPITQTDFVSHTTDSVRVVVGL